MKKIIRVLLVVMLVMSMVTPAFAAEDFVGSIPGRPDTGLGQMGTDENGDPYYGVITDEHGNITHLLYPGQIIVTPYAKIDASTVLPQSTKDLMHKVHGELEDGTVKLSDVPGLADKVKDKLGADVDVDKTIVVYDLYDVTVINPEALGLGTGSTLTITFNLSIGADRFLEVMAYNGSGWGLVPFTNNGSTITVTLAGPGPVAFLVDVADEGGDNEGGTVGGDEDQDKDDEGTGEDVDQPETGDDRNPLLWGGICAAAALGVVLLVFLSKRDKEEAEEK